MEFLHSKLDSMFKMPSNKQTIKKRQKNSSNSLLAPNEYVLVFGTTVLSVVMSVWIVVLHSTDLAFLFLDLRAKGSDVSSKDDLLGGG